VALPMSTNASQPALQWVNTFVPLRINPAPCRPMARQWSTSSLANSSAAASANDCCSSTLAPACMCARTWRMAFTGSTAVGRAALIVSNTTSTCFAKASMFLPRNARAPCASP
jgi:hypothetical protein